MRCAAIAVIGVLAACLGGCGALDARPSGSAAAPQSSGAASQTLPAGATATASPASSGGAVASPSGSPPPDQVLTCGLGGPTFPASALIGPPRLTGDPTAISALNNVVQSGSDPAMPADGWSTVIDRTGEVTFLASDDHAAWWVVTLTHADGRWQDTEAGECHLAILLPAGRWYAEWRTDPKHAPKATSTSVAVLATEQSCANGRAPGARLLPPVVVETATSVTITLLVRRLANADCPSNPEVRVVVSLARPLGHRTLLDGSAFPPAPR